MNTRTEVKSARFDTHYTHSVAEKHPFLWFSALCAPWCQPWIVIATRERLRFEVRPFHPLHARVATFFPTAVTTKRYVLLCIPLRSSLSCRTRVCHANVGKKQKQKNKNKKTKTSKSTHTLLWRERHKKLYEVYIRVVYIYVCVYLYMEEFALIQRVSFLQWYGSTHTVCFHGAASLQNKNLSAHRPHSKIKSKINDRLLFLRE